MSEVEFIDITTPAGEVLRITYEMTIGDVVIVSVISMLLFYHIIKSIISIIWRR